MFKQLTTAIILTAFAMQNFTGVLIWADYYTNTTAYAKNCVNKATPVLHCNGKCQVMKKMQDQQKKEQDNNTRRPNTKTETLFLNNAFAILDTPSPYIIQQQKNGYYINCKSTGLHLDIFHPPRV